VERPFSDHFKLFSAPNLNGPCCFWCTPNLVNYEHSKGPVLGTSPGFPDTRQWAAASFCGFGGGLARLPEGGVMALAAPPPYQPHSSGRATPIRDRSCQDVANLKASSGFAWDLAWCTIQNCSEYAFCWYYWLCIADENFSLMRPQRPERTPIPLSRWQRKVLRLPTGNVSQHSLIQDQTQQ